MLDSLQRRSRGLRLVALKRRLTDPTGRRAAILRELQASRRRETALSERLAELAPLEAVPLGRSPRTSWREPGSVTRSFAAQLGDWQPDLEALDAESRRAWEDGAGSDRAFLHVMLAVWQDAPGFCERTGLRRDDPPEHVHAMARGPLAAGGGLSAADLLVDAHETAGIPLAGISRALDFGASSGRVVRVMQAAFPSVEWHGCDPNAGAIEWASEHLPAVTFHVSEQEPPLPFRDAHFDLVYAISVWSHLSERAALRWFDEMHRVVRPGGVLVPTLQCWQTTYHLAVEELWTLRDVRAAIADLYEQGHHFREIFGSGGDFGVVSRDWGFALMSPEWLIEQLTPAWEVLSWRPGALQGNQDLVVLRRR